MFLGCQIQRKDNEMDKKILKQLIEMGVDRPIQSYRMVGNRRIEVHLLGDDLPTIFDLSGTTGGAVAEPTAQPGAGRGQAVEWSDLTVKELQRIARKNGIKYGGLRKAELVKVIERKVAYDG
jgi:hypothetical protein